MEKKTWAGINQLINGKKKKSKSISSLRRFNNCKRFIIPFSDLISIKVWEGRNRCLVCLEVP